MGRRNRSNRNSWEDGEDGDYELERAEKAWISKRRKLDGGNDSTRGDESSEKKSNQGNNSSKRATEQSDVQPQNNNDGASTGRPNTSASAPSSSADEDKIQRMKLKKRRQKERRKEKKAQATASAKSIKQGRIESEKRLHNKQKQEKDKKSKINEQSAKNKFSTLSKGVQYQDLIIGKGQVVQHRKKCRVSYTLRSKSHTSGKIIDSSQNFGFRLGKGEVIQGYDIGLQGMRVGGIRRLVVPSAAGYGNKDVGAGRGADLFFQIELLYVAP